MQAFFHFLATNPYILLFLAVGLAVWIGRQTVMGYGLGMVAAAIRHSDGRGRRRAKPQWAVSRGCSGDPVQRALDWLPGCLRSIRRLADDLRLFRHGSGPIVPA